MISILSSIVYLLILFSLSTLLFLLVLFLGTSEPGIAYLLCLIVVQLLLDTFGKLKK
ncbi:hypothetical protein [Gracilibacillus salinarum]|uniref:Uncharacterized protein n=1 Tax=Gracilibacillus salinarum TaxID=2932255 RepID=A0ABY4GL16_9BACI|nr:hypothetical protein [Gracilibacillus salinarum]UOQ84924.1 hypothetical protein MUN87_20105 [Gracilibacillus salinarum]